MKFLRQTVSLTHVWLFLAWNADMVSLGGRRYFLIIVISAKTWYLWFEMIKYLSNLITHQTPETWSQQFWYSLCCHQNICLNQINDTYTPHSYLFCDIVLTDWLVGNLHMTVVTDSFNYPGVGWDQGHQCGRICGIILTNYTPTGLGRTLVTVTWSHDTGAQVYITILCIQYHYNKIAVNIHSDQAEILTTTTKHSHLLHELTHP